MITRRKTVTVVPLLVALAACTSTAGKARVRPPVGSTVAPPASTTVAEPSTVPDTPAVPSPSRRLLPSARILGPGSWWTDSRRLWNGLAVADGFTDGGETYWIATMEVSEKGRGKHLRPKGRTTDPKDTQQEET